MMRKIFINLLALSVLLMPVLVFSQEADLVPGCEGWDCSFADFLNFINDIIEVLIFKISVPVAILIILYAGFQYLFSGVSGKKADAKKMLGAVVFGFAIMLGAWIFINFILDVLLKDNFTQTPPLAE